MSKKSRDDGKDHVTLKSREYEPCHVVVRKRRRSEHDSWDRRREKESYIRSLIDRGKDVFLFFLSIYIKPIVNLLIIVLHEV